MRHFSGQDKERIQAAIRAAEAGTSGQFVAVVARCSDHYWSVPLLWASILALVLPGVLLFLPVFLGWEFLYQLQLLVFVVLAAIFLLVPGVAVRLIPRKVKYHRAQRLAHALFYERGVHRTREHSGVLFFVSLAERYVEIVADQGIHEQMGEARWQEIIGLFVSCVRQGQIVEGFIQAIGSCGEAMQRYYPADSTLGNELSDGLVEL
ncbi:MAG: TPM domain-containing protein [Proteobacteria bacterium]|nr:TPM domain-containing protein [Pseudomonadota bacterium]